MSYYPRQDLPVQVHGINPVILECRYRNRDFIFEYTWDPERRRGSEEIAFIFKRNFGYLDAPSDTMQNLEFRFFIVIAPTPEGDSVRANVDVKESAFIPNGVRPEL